MNSIELVRLTRTKKLSGEFLVASNELTRLLPGTSTLLPMPWSSLVSSSPLHRSCCFSWWRLTIVARAPSMSPCLKFVHLLFWFDVLAFELESTWEPMHDDLLFALPR